MKLRLFTVSPPDKDLPIVNTARFGTVTLSASSSTEFAIYSAHSAVNLNAIKLTLDTVLTGTGAAGAGATLYINRYNSAGVKQGADGAVASIQLNTGKNVSALTLTDVGTLAGAALGVTQLAKGDTLTLKWAQGGTGLALPSGNAAVNYGIAGTPR